MLVYAGVNVRVDLVCVCMCETDVLVACARACALRLVLVRVCVWEYAVVSAKKKGRYQNGPESLQTPLLRTVIVRT